MKVYYYIKEIFYLFDLSLKLGGQVNLKKKKDIWYVNDHINYVYLLTDTKYNVVWWYT